MTTLKVGIVAPFGSARELVGSAVEADQAGWDGWFTWDAIDLPGFEVDVWDPWTLLAAAAVRTERVALGALVFALPRRRPWVFAHQALTVDHLSGGRVVIPVGLGVPEDRGLTGVAGEPRTLRERAQLLDECLDVLGHAFTGESFSYDGVHHRLTDLTIRPAPASRPRPPLWVVGAFPSDRSMGRAVRWDGVVPQLRGERTMDQLGPDDVREIVAWVRDHGAAEGPFDVVVQGALSGDRVADAERLAALEEAGATWFVDSQWEGDAATLAAGLARIRAGVPGR